MTIESLKKYNIFKNEKLKTLRLVKNQGFCNNLFIIKTSKNSYILRVFKNSIMLNRKNEYKIQQKAYLKNIAAKPVFIFKNKFMIYKFLKGKHIFSLDTNNIKLLSKSIKKLHNIKSDMKKHDLKKDLLYYKNILKDKNSRQDIKKLKKSIKKLKNYNKQFSIVHHDLNPKNVIFYKNSVKFIDWEYVGINDIYFDLATICVEYKLSNKESKIFLKEYFKNKGFDMSKLKIYKVIYKILCRLWFKID